jgi:hypothetical protein
MGHRLVRVATQAMQVIGAGFGRTGTMSLKAALEQLLGRPCYHMVELQRRPEHLPLWERALAGDPDWPRLLDGYGGAVDWPSSAFWLPLTRHFPSAKVILTERPADEWYDSFMSTIFRTLSNPAAKDPRHRAFTRALIFEHVFGGQIGDRTEVIRRYVDSGRAVRAALAPDRLLVYEPGHGWEPLCQFLQLPVPAAPYPHQNRRAEFIRAFV